MIYVWKEPLDHTGDHTYEIDFTKEMTALNTTLNDVTVVLGTAATAAGLEVDHITLGSPAVKVSFKFRIPLTSNQVFTKKGKPLGMQIRYTTASGEIDAFEAAVHIKNK